MSKIGQLGAPHSEMKTLERLPETHEGFDFPTPNLLTRLREIVDYLFYIAYSIISLIVILELAGASDKCGFKEFLNRLTLPLLGGFVGMFPDPIFAERYRLRISYFAALFVYLLLHVAVYGFMRLVDPKRWKF